MTDAELDRLDTEEQSPLVRDLIVTLRAARTFNHVIAEERDEALAQYRLLGRALLHATRAMQAGDDKALMNVHPQVQPLVDAAMSRALVMLNARTGRTS